MKNSLLDPYSGLLIKNIEKGIGSFILFDLINCKTSELVHKCWIYLADWEIYNQNSRILDCDETQLEKYTNVFKKIEGKILLELVVDEKDETIRFNIEGNYQINLESDLDEYELCDDLLMIFDSNSDDVLSFSPEKGLYQENKHTLPNSP